MHRHAVFCLTLLHAYMHIYQGDQCTMKIDNTPLNDAIDTFNMAVNSIWPRNTSGGFDLLFRMLRSPSPSSLVILMDTSKEIGPNHFYLVNKPMIEAFLNYHVAYRYVNNYMSLIAFNGSGYSTLCKYVRNSCNQMVECMKSLTYDRDDTVLGIATGILKAFEESKRIFNSLPTAEAALLVLSGFKMAKNVSRELDAIKDIKQQLSLSGIKVYTILSSSNNKNTVAKELASSEKEYMEDHAFLLKLQQTTISELSCGYLPTAQTNMVCNMDELYISKCNCKFGYSGTKCTAPSYCNDPNACPNNSLCSMENDGRSYHCTCPSCDYTACMNSPDIPKTENVALTTSPASTSGQNSGQMKNGGSSILTIVFGTIGGILLVCLVIAIVLIIRKHCPALIFKPTSWPRRTSEVSQRGYDENYSNQNYQEDYEDQDVVDNMKMRQFAVTHRGMDTWATFTRQLLAEGKLNDICIISEDMLQFCSSSMQFMPHMGELGIIKDWLAGYVKVYDEIEYKGKTYKVLQNSDGIIQALSLHQNPRTRFCLCSTGDYYIIAIREKTQERGDMKICCDIVEDIKNALNAQKENAQNDNEATPDSDSDDAYEAFESPGQHTPPQSPDLSFGQTHRYVNTTEIHKIDVNDNFTNKLDVNTNPTRQKPHLFPKSENTSDSNIVRLPSQPLPKPSEKYVRPHLFLKHRNTSDTNISQSVQPPAEQMIKPNLLPKPQNTSESALANRAPQPLTKESEKMTKPHLHPKPQDISCTNVTNPQLVTKSSKPMAELIVELQSAVKAPNIRRINDPAENVYNSVASISDSVCYDNAVTPM